MLKVALLILS